MRLLPLYLKRSFQKNGKNFIFILLAATLTIILMTIVTVFVDSNRKGTEIYIIKSCGTHNVFLSDMDNEKATFVKNHDTVASVQEVKYIDTDIKLKMNRLKAASVKGTIDSWMYEFTSGSMPEKGEVLIPDALKQADGEIYLPGDKITISFSAEGKTIQNTYKVAGTFPNYLLCRSYILLSDDTFHALQQQLKSNELMEDMYIKVKNYYDSNILVRAIVDKYKKTDIITNGTGTLIPELIFLYTILITLAMLVGGVCIFTVISLYLKDSNKEYILFRFLGATNRQILSVILLQLLIVVIIALPVGFSIGVALSRFIMLQFKNLSIHIIFNVSAFSKICIPLFSVAVIFIAGYKPIHDTLSLPPIQSLVKHNSRKSIISSYKTQPEKHFQKPYLWYAGVQVLRFKGRTAFLCLTTTVCMSLFTVINVIFGYQSAMTEKTLEKAQFTLNIDADEIKLLEAREKGEAVGFRKEDIDRLSQIPEIRYIKINQIIGQMIRLEPEKKKLDHNSISSGGEYYLANGSVQLLDSFEQKHLEKYVVAGSLDKVEADTNSIVLQDDNWSKSKSTSYQIGDKLVLQGMTTNSKIIEFTIKAIVKGVPGNNNKINLYIAPVSFYELFNIDPNSLNIYCDTDKISEVRDTLNKDSRKGGYVVKDNSDTDETMYKEAKAIRFFGLILSTNVLLICTVLLLCYYTYYYKTRQKEFRCLGAIGSSEGMITRLILNESIIYAVISTTASLLISYLICYYIYTKTSGYPNDFEWKIPWVQMAISVFMIMMINVISVYSSIKRIHGLSLVISDE